MNTNKNLDKENIKLNWDLSEFYKSITDPRINEDMYLVERACESFERKYKGKLKTTSAKALNEIFVDYEKLIEIVSEARPLYYTWYLTSIDSTNMEVQALEKLLQARFTSATNRITFFDVELSKTPKEYQPKLLADKSLQKYKHFLSEAFKRGKYTLATGEENILSLVSQPAHGEWTNFIQNKVNDIVILWKGKTIPLAEAEGLLRILPKKDRYALDQLMKKELIKLTPDVQAEMTSIVINKKISDELRGFTKPYQSRLMSDQIGEKTVDALRQAVNKYRNISYKFYEIKAKLLKLPKLKYVDRSAPVGSLNKTYTFDEAYNFVHNSFTEVDGELAAEYENFFKNGQVDVFPKAGKRGGAFCSSSYNKKTRILLNYTESFDSTKTIAHEFGHAFHSFYSFKHQPLMYTNYSTPVAEVASTFFENFVQDKLMATLKGKEKVVALCDFLNSSISTIFRQIACFEMECEIHAEVKNTGMITGDKLQELHNKHMAGYLGPIFEFEKADGLMAYRWPHIRDFFYVFSYAFGELVSNALYGMYKKDPAYLEKVKDFMRAGGNGTAEEIFAKAGIDVTDPKFFEEGLKHIESQIKELEQLVK